MLPWILLAVLGQQPREDLPTHEKVGTQYPTTEYKYKPDVATTYEQWRSTATVKPGYLKPKARYVKDTTFIPTEQKLEKFETSFPAAVEPKKYLKKPKARYATFTPTVREFKKFETSVPEARLYKPKEAKIELEYDNSYHPKSDYIYYPKSDAYGMYANGVYNYDVPTEDYGYDIYYPKTHDYGMYANGVYNYDAPTKDYGYVNGHYDSQYPTDYHYENTYDNTYEPSSVYGHYDSQYPTHYDYENTYNHYTYGPSSGYTDDIMLEKESSNEPTSAVDDSHYDDSEAKHPEDHDSKTSYDNSHDSPSGQIDHDYVPKHKIQCSPAIQRCCLPQAKETGLLCRFLIKEMRQECCQISSQHKDTRVPIQGPSITDSPWRKGDHVFGGDSDKHGCLPSAGESWCEKLGTCVHQWKLPNGKCPTSSRWTAPPVDGHYDSQSPTYHDYENINSHGYVDDSHSDDSEAKHPEDHDSKYSYYNSHDSTSSMIKDNIMLEQGNLETGPAMIKDDLMLQKGKMRPMTDV